MNWNKTDIIGNVGVEPELRFTANGRPVTSFSVAVNNRYTTKDGEKKEETEWFAVVAWGKLAEICNQHVVKGMLVFVSGKISLHKWESQEGKDMSRLQLVANNVIFLSRTDKGEVDNSTSAGIDTEPEDVPF